MLKMKVIVFLIFSLVSLNIFSEEYVCSAELSAYGEPGEVQTKVFQRKGNMFKHITKDEENYREILLETEEFIILVQTYTIPSVYMIYLDKKNGNFTEDFLFLDKEVHTTKRLVGKCLIRN